MPEIISFAIMDFVQVEIEDLVFAIMVMDYNLRATPLDGPHILYPLVGGILVWLHHTCLFSCCCLHWFGVGSSSQAQRVTAIILPASRFPGGTRNDWLSMCWWVW